MCVLVVKAWLSSIQRQEVFTKSYRQYNLPFVLTDAFYSGNLSQTQNLQMNGPAAEEFLAHSANVGT